MRLGLIAVVLVLPLFGCGASIPVFHRTPIDMVVSVVSGRDCSIVNLDKGEQYCSPREPPLQRPVFCTRSLGVADCWADPENLPGHPREVADGPRRLTREQEKQRTHSWPGLW
jgi:hypothetical protein